MFSCCTHLKPVAFRLKSLIGPGRFASPHRTHSLPTSNLPWPHQCLMPFFPFPSRFFLLPTWFLLLAAAHLSYLSSRIILYKYSFLNPHRLTAPYYFSAMDLSQLVNTNLIVWLIHFPSIPL